MPTKWVMLAAGLAMAAPMAAHAGPTVYGHLNTELTSESSDAVGGNIKTDKPFDGNLIQNNNRWAEDGTGVQDEQRGRIGIKGDEDLGGGLKAIYQFEWQVDTATADVADGTRNSYVGLKGGFGSIKMGSLKTPYKYFGGVKYDPFTNTSAEARRFGGISAGVYGHNSFLQRSLGYENKLGGGKLWIVYSPDEQNGQDGDYSIGYKVKGSNWEAFAASANQNDTDGNSSTAELAYNAVKLGGQWKSGPHQISGQYEMTTNEQTGGDDEGTLLYLNYQMKMGKNAFSASYGTGEVDYAGAGADQENTFFSVGVTHRFSKKTRLMLAYSDSEVENIKADTGTLAAGDTLNRDALVAALRVDF